MIWLRQTCQKQQNGSHGSAGENFAIPRPLRFMICKKFQEQKCPRNCISRSSGRFGSFGWTHVCQKQQNGTYGSAGKNLAIPRPLRFIICKKFREQKCRQNCTWRSSGRFGCFGWTGTRTSKTQSSPYRKVGHLPGGFFLLFSRLYIDFCKVLKIGNNIIKWKQS